MSPIIYPTSYRVNLEVGGVTFVVAPLTFQQKTEILSCISKKGGVDVEDNARMAFLTVKYGVKDVKGVALPDGDGYKPAMENGVLTDDATSEILGLETQEKLILAMAKLLRSFKDPKIAGVKFDAPKTVTKKKS